MQKRKETGQSRLVLSKMCNVAGNVLALLSLFWCMGFYLVFYNRSDSL